MLAASENSHISRPGVEPTPRVLTILSFVLERLVARNDQLVASLSTGSGPEGADGTTIGREDSAGVGKRLKGFHGVRAPSISIGKYMERIYRYTDCSPSCFVVGYVYIDRVAHAHPESLVLSLNVHRLLLTSLLLASKMFDDTHHNNAFYARVGGVSKMELNKLELELLFLLDFGLMVNSRDFETYCQCLESEMMMSTATIHKLNRPPMNSSPSNSISNNNQLDNTGDDSTEITLLPEDAQSSSSNSNSRIQ